MNVDADAPDPPVAPDAPVAPDPPVAPTSQQTYTVAVLRVDRKQEKLRRLRI